jgi:quinol monooxygenase YgiN
MTVLRARVEAGAAERLELAQALKAWAGSARSEAGSVDVRVCEDLEEPGVYCLTSRWRDSQRLEAHLAGPAFGILLGALEILARRTQLELEASTGTAEDATVLIRRLRARQRSTSGGVSGPDNGLTQ